MRRPTAAPKVALRPRVERPAGRPPQIEFEIFTPTHDREVSPGTVSRAKARCLACGAVLPPERVRAQLAAQRGGADVIFDSLDQSPSEPPSPSGRGAGGEGAPRRLGGARLLAVVTIKPSPSGRGRGEGGRHYRLPTARDYQAVFRAQQRPRCRMSPCRPSAPWASGCKDTACSSGGICSRPGRRWLY
ncbi:MAG: hypothetical protein JRI66_13535 [Deltaproteobacteria bacterium]|nr:hypothetical protein [Deltaproteobacteria bacterium]